VLPGEPKARRKCIAGALVTGLALGYYLVSKKEMIVNAVEFRPAFKQAAASEKCRVPATKKPLKK
jgi:hypothetical protein